MPILSRGFLEGEDEDFGWALPAKGGERPYARLAACLKASRQPKKKVYYKGKRYKTTSHWV
jgi:hypothetical protein